MSLFSSLFPVNFGFSIVFLKAGAPLGPLADRLHRVRARRSQEDDSLLSWTIDIGGKAPRRNPFKMARAK
jgi:hypothetical protein